MTPIPLGILDFPTAAAGDFNLLETQVLTSDTTSVTFTGLGSYTDYKHLQIRAVSRHTASNNNNLFTNLNFNGDTGSNYSRHYLYGTGASIFSQSSTSGSAIYSGMSASNLSTANAFAGNIIDILDFSNSNKNTTVRALGGSHNSLDTDITLFSGAWLNTSAVTSIELSCVLGSYLAGSRFSLYGVK